MIDSSSTYQHDSQNVDHDEVLKSIQTFYQPGQVYELRIPKVGKRGTISGYFNDFGKLAEAIIRESGKVPAVYVTLNPVKPALLARCANRTKDNAATTSADTDVSCRKWLLIDFDPLRVSGISSTDTEKAAAWVTSREAKEWLLNQGVPASSIVLGDSGNGYHFNLRIDLENNQENTTLCEKVLKALDAKFTRKEDGGICVDTTTFNAARISKVYGTKAMKGDSTEDRPHRLSKHIEVPDVITVCPTDILRQIASFAPTPQSQQPKQPYTGNGTAINAEKWIAEHGLRVRKSKQIAEGGTLYELSECPFDPSHDHGEATITQFSSGALAFRCKHNSCQGNDWHALRQKLGDFAHSVDRPVSFARNPVGDKENEGVLGGEENKGGDGNTPKMPNLGTNTGATSVTKRYKTLQTDTGATVVTPVTNVTGDSIRQVILSLSGYIRYSDLDRECGITDGTGRILRRTTISRMKEEGLVETLGMSVRRKETASEKVVFDFSTPPSDGLNASFPFHEETKIKVFPKFLGVVAGSKDAGKTAYMMNFARLNCFNFKVHYFMNGEIGLEQMKNRLRNFPDAQEWVSRVDWQIVPNHFQDVIFPDDINIIDYLEVNRDFYLVAEDIKAIHEKHKEGICLMGLQKKKSTENDDALLGRGGEFSRQRASFYLALDNKKSDEGSKATIVTGKDWRHDLEDPAYQFVNYKLVQGVRFVCVSEWQGGKLLPKQVLGETGTLKMEDGREFD